ncbi:ubiquitinyl hydrolase 1 [Ancylostoma duodenale]|uniref:ubiquitinyl hydrolase 1 n=1 Tax=Ancylostoma duodenale TaxID=51022 RepID=A0A0C2GTU3_9BILA|nr:ubiquitinyl hydrolase 1 [Ancylostoma duodenale]
MVICLIFDYPELHVTDPTGIDALEKKSPTVVQYTFSRSAKQEGGVPSSGGLTGLFNLGNTCYFNAAIQVLSNCPPFSDYFRDKGDLRPYATREPLVSNTMALLIQKLWSAKREPAVFPKALLTRVRDNFPQFRGWNQQDAQELIRCLLELLHSELGQPVYPHEDYSAFAPKTLERHSSTSSNGSDHELGQPVYPHEDYSAFAPKTLERHSSTSSNGSDQFETADSGWSSDGDTTCTSTDSRRSCAEKVEKQKAANVPVRWRSIVTDVFDGSIESSVTCLTCKTVSTTTETFQDLSLPIPSAEHLSRIRQCSSGESDVDDGAASDLNSGYGWIPWFSWLRSFSSVFVTPSVSLEDCLSAFFSPDRLVGDDMYSCDRCKKYEYDDSTLTKLDSAHVLTKEAYVLLYQKRPSLSVEAARNKTMEMISAEEIVKAQSKSQLYISSEWLLKLSTFSDPGPVTNYSFLCRHGHLLPRRVDHISSLCTPVPAVLGHYLLNRFGGGPAVSELHYCLVCDKHWRWLQEKRAVEQTRFRQLEDAVFLTDQPQWSEAELRDVLNAVDEKLWAANAKLKKHVATNL